MFQIKGAGTDICKRGCIDDNEGGRHNNMRSKTEKRTEAPLIYVIFYECDYKMLHMIKRSNTRKIQVH